MEHLETLRLDDTFQFSCHPGIGCFNECCRDLNQFLTPYDIFRLKTRLGLTSQQFLQRYTECHIGPRTGLPVISLRMLPEENLRCPFVRLEGCTVYEDRPGSCRTYPLGRIAVRRTAGGGCEESYFLIKEAHCLGFKESTQWTVREWKKDQQLSAHNEMNDLVMEVLSLKNRSKSDRLTDSENELFCMAFYDLDQFRDFTFAKRLWEAAPVGEGMVEKMREDDIALLRFGIKWIKERLFSDIRER